MRRFPEGEWTISLDTARDPADVLHAEDGSEALYSLSDVQHEESLVHLTARYFHGRHMRKVVHATFSVLSRDPDYFPRYLHKENLIEGLPSRAVWRKTGIDDTTVYRTEFSYPCLDSKCPADWRVELVAMVTPIEDRLL